MGFFFVLSDIGTDQSLLLEEESECDVEGESFRLGLRLLVVINTFNCSKGDWRILLSGAGRFFFLVVDGFFLLLLRFVRLAALLLDDWTWMGRLLNSLCSSSSVPLKDSCEDRHASSTDGRCFDAMVQRSFVLRTTEMKVAGPLIIFERAITGNNVIK
jgi:hypothetical protein